MDAAGFYYTVYKWIIEKNEKKRDEENFFLYW